MSTSEGVAQPEHGHKVSVLEEYDHTSEAEMSFKFAISCLVSCASEETFCSILSSDVVISDVHGHAVRVLVEYDQISDADAPPSLIL